MNWLDQYRDTSASILKLSDHDVNPAPGEAKVLDAFDLVEAQGYEPLVTISALASGEMVQSDSQLWTSRFLSDVANPYSSNIPARRSIFRARNGLPDILRCEYDIHLERVVESITVSVIVEETAQWIRMRPRLHDVDFARLEGERRLLVIAWLADRVLRLKGTHRSDTENSAYHEWVFQYRSLSEGAWFSTSPSTVPYAMWSWADRVDGGIRHEQLYFLGYKRLEPANGKLVFQDESRWFQGRTP